MANKNHAHEVKCQQLLRVTILSGAKRVTRAANSVYDRLIGTSLGTWQRWFKCHLNSGRGAAEPGSHAERQRGMGAERSAEPSGTDGPSRLAA